MSTIQTVLNFKRSPGEDFYAVLHCDENSTVEQIQAEYKIQALNLHPDKNNGDKESEAKFKLLKEAKETLCNPENRSNYDKWRNSGISISYKNWKNMKEHVGQSLHWATPKTKDRMLPETDSAHKAGGNSNFSVMSTSSAFSRTSDGGAELYADNHTKNWSVNNSDVANKFRNYEI